LARAQVVCTENAVGVGGDSITASPLGMKVLVAGEPSVLPEASVAHTLKVYSVPAVRPL
jgi:hypothetical protein